MLRISVPRTARAGRGRGQLRRAAADRHRRFPHAGAGQRHRGRPGHRAGPGDRPAGPVVAQRRRNIALGIAFGLLLGIAFALLRNFLDTKVRGEQEVRALTDSPVLGSIALDDQLARHSVFVADQPQSRSAEAIRRLRTNLQFVGNGNDSKAVVVTSAVAGEGKSTTTINLGASLADAGARVVVVDANLRRPSIASFTGDDDGAGLSTVLIGQAQLDDVIRPWRDTSLAVLPSGPVPPNPSELLGSAAMWELLTKLTASYDVVLLDTPPLLPVTDATILTTMVGGASSSSGPTGSAARSCRRRSATWRPPAETSTASSSTRWASATPRTSGTATTRTTPLRPPSAGPGPSAPRRPVRSRR